MELKFTYRNVSSPYSRYTHQVRVDFISPTVGSYAVLQHVLSRGFHRGELKAWCKENIPYEVSISDSDSEKCTYYYFETLEDSIWFKLAMA